MLVVILSLTNIRYDSIRPTYNQSGIRIPDTYVSGSLQAIGDSMVSLGEGPTY